MSSAAEGEAEPKGKEPSASEWRKLASFLAVLDFARRPETKLAWLVRIIVLTFALTTLWKRVDATTAVLRKAKPLPPIPTQEIDDYRFRLPERVRREIFADLATAELAERARAIQANTWNGHLWSREDDRGHYERVAARQAAAKYRISLSQVYLVLDEGIRERWPAPNGEPLPATTPPLNTRQSW